MKSFLHPATLLLLAVIAPPVRSADPAPLPSPSPVVPSPTAPSTAPIRATPTTAPVPSRPPPLHFSVHARYRGSVEQAFRHIGWARLDSRVVDEAVFRVEAEARITHPEEKRNFEMTLDMEFALRRSRLRILDSKNRYNDASRSYRHRIERAIPFLHLIRSAAPPAPAEDPARRYRLEGVEYTLRYARTQRHLEVSLHDDQSILAIFFLAATPEGIDLVKFRVPAGGGVTVSFVRSDPGTAGPGKVMEPDEAALE